MDNLKRKICVLGAFAVGKTSLVQRFVHDRFSEKYLTTVGASVSQKLMPPVRNRRRDADIQPLFLIWDIAGLEKMDKVVTNYFHGAHGALAVCDLTRPETFEALMEICDNFRSVCPTAPLIIVGNKLDLVQDEVASVRDLNQLAAKLDSGLMLTSAKSGHQVGDAFYHLAEKIEQSHD